MSTLSLKKPPKPPTVEVPRNTAPASPVAVVTRAPVGAAEFWFIWCPSGNRPRARHASLEIAVAEQARLSALIPTEQFYVYRAQRIDPAKAQT